MNDIVKADSDLGSSMVAVIAKAASDTNVDVDKMEKLLDMQERIMNKQAEIDFNSSMAKMQNDIPTIIKSSNIVVNNEVRSTYAKLENILDTIRPIMKEHGFAVSFKLDSSESEITVTGILMHQSGHREQTSMTLPADKSGAKNSVQAVGSSVSYGKRYVLCALLNIATGDDDDGNGSETITADQVMEIAGMVSGKKGIEKKVLDYVGVDAIHLIPSVMLGDVMQKLNNTKAISDG